MTLLLTLSAMFLMGMGALIYAAGYSHGYDDRLNNKQADYYGPLA